MKRLVSGLSNVQRIARVSVQLDIIEIGCNNTPMQCTADQTQLAAPWVLMYLTDVSLLKCPLMTLCGWQISLTLCIRMLDTAN